MRIFILTAIVCGFASQLLAQNLLLNSSFEHRDPSSFDRPSAWSAVAGSTPLEFTGEHHEGATAALLLGDQTEHSWQQTVVSPHGNVFTLSAWIKGENIRLNPPGDFACLEARFFYKGQPSVNVSPYILKIPPGTYDWQNLSVSTSVSSKDPIDRIVVTIRGRMTSGAAMIDQVELNNKLALSPSALLLRKIDNLTTQLKRIGEIDRSVLAASEKLAHARDLLGGEKPDLDKATLTWITAAREISPAVWATIFPDAMTDKSVEARMLFHGMAPTKEGCDQYIDVIDHTGCNGVFLSLGSWMSVIYHSQLVPIEPGWEKFDALKYFIEQEHARHIKVFGYVAALCGTSTPPNLPGLFQHHPDWFAKSPDRDMPIFPDPAKPYFIDFMVKMYGELAQAYDLDGIGLDYMRYPTVTALNYDGNNRNQILQRAGLDILAKQEPVVDPREWVGIKRYRAQVIENLVARVTGDLKRKRPSISTVACLLSDPDEAIQYGQDWSTSSRFFDYAIPMNYDDTSGQERLLNKQLDIFRRNRTVYIPSIGGMPDVHASWTISDWATRVAIQHKIGGDGIIIYRIADIDPAVSAFFLGGPFHHSARFPEPLNKTGMSSDSSAGQQ